MARQVFQATLVLVGDFSLFRDFTDFAILVSVLLHVAVGGLLLSEPMKSQVPVIVSVRYQEGEKKSPESVAKTLRIKSKPLNAQSRASAKTAAKTNPLASANGVSGESLGLRAHYPRLSRLLGEAGQVQVEIMKTERAAVLQSSSGFERLDQSALAAVQLALQDHLLDNELLERESLTVNFVFKLID